MAEMSFDKRAHWLFALAKNMKLYRAGTGVKCTCGAELEVYYCENRLYIIRCQKCNIVSLIKAGSSGEAAEKAMPAKMDNRQVAVALGRLMAYENTGLTPEQVSYITGSCKGCIWANRHQKCSCCARNKHMKDNYQLEE